MGQTCLGRAPPGSRRLIGLAQVDAESQAGGGGGNSSCTGLQARESRSQPGADAPGYNQCMKVWIVLLSMLAAACVWAWGPHRRTAASGWRRRSKQISQSLLAGVAVYFSIMSVALVYLMLTQP